MSGEPNSVSRWWKAVPLELVLVGSLLGLLFLVSVLASVGWFVLVRGGMAISIVSAGIGLPLEAVYFGLMLLYARRDGGWKRGWIWRSFEHHHRLSRNQRWAAMPFFYLGALAFGIASLATIATVFGLFLGHGASWKPG